MITTLAVFRFDPATAEMVLASYHPGQSVETVRAATGWDLRVAPDVRETRPRPPPTSSRWSATATGKGSGPVEPTIAERPGGGG